jgi:hypothetical protein
MSENGKLVKREVESLVPHGSEWLAMREQADVMVKSGFLPAHLKTPEQVIAVMLAGRDLKIPPSTAIRNLFVVQGRVSMSADLMLALAYSRIPGFKFGVTRSTPEVAEVWSMRPGSDKVNTVFTIKEAGAAGLTDKDIWRKYTAQMLLARAKAGNLRITAADALAGVYTPGELGGEEILTTTEVQPKVVMRDETIIDVTDNFEEVKE